MGEGKLKITGATLLSTEEAERLPKHLRKYGHWWWLRSPGRMQKGAASVDGVGWVDFGGRFGSNDSDFVRPALKIKNLESSGFKTGDRFKFGESEFEIISDNAAFCCTDIGCYPFRKDWKAEDANDYKKSDIKRYVEAWFESVITPKPPLTPLQIDYDLLYKQRGDLLKVSFGEKEAVDPDVIEGLINLCDALLDNAEENGEFTFPENED